MKAEVGSVIEANYLVGVIDIEENGSDCAGVVDCLERSIWETNKTVLYEACVYLVANDDASFVYGSGYGSNGSGIIEGREIVRRNRCCCVYLRCGCQGKQDDKG